MRPSIHTTVATVIAVLVGVATVIATILVRIAANIVNRVVAWAKVVHGRAVNQVVRGKGWSLHSSAGLLPLVEMAVDWCATLSTQHLTIGTRSLGHSIALSSKRQ